MKLLKYFFQFCAIFALFCIFKTIGYKNASNFGSKVGRVLGKLIRSNKIILKNISQISKNSDFIVEDEDKLVKDVFSNYGRILSDYVYLSKFRKGSLKEYVNIKGNNYLEEIKSKNKKVVFISGHFNNFELMAMFIDSAGIKLSTIYRPLNNVFLNKVMENIRIKHICKNQIKKGLDGLREIFRFLKNNYSIAMMIDQRVRQGEKVNFFKKKAHTTNLPALIAKKFKCQIVTIKIKRFENNKFKITIEKPITFSENETSESITSKLNTWIEKAILENPSQWIWTHNRWKN